MAKQQMKVKKVPERKCLGCQTSKPKQELLRIVRTPDGAVSIDPSGKKSGRGCYICKELSCLKKAAKAKRIERSLDCPIPEEIYLAMEKELTELDR